MIPFGFGFRICPNIAISWEPAPIAQSICTHYSNLSGRPDIFLGSGTLKKVQNMGFKKLGAKNQGHSCYSKREEVALLLLFLNNKDPVFCTLLFATHILDLFLQGHKPTHLFKTRIVGADYLGKRVIKLRIPWKTAWFLSLPQTTQA